MPQTRQFEFRQPISPYVCSTPADFHEERAFLSTVIFPQIDQLCRQRGTHFSPTDLCWSPGDSKTQKGLLLKTQLDAIRRSGSYFIGILGETYGPHREMDAPMLHAPQSYQGSGDWLDKNLVLAGSGGHLWVLKEGHHYSSITELEVTLGAFLSDTTHTFMYYRQQEHLEDKLAALDVNDTDRDKVIQIHSSESEHAKVKIHDLKQKLVKKGVPVKYFRTLEELGQHVMDDWTEVIDIVLPPLRHDVALLDTLEYQEWLAQQSFLANHADVFVSTDEIVDTLETMNSFAKTCARGDNKEQIEKMFAATPGGSRIRGYSATAWIKKQALPSSVGNSSNILLLSGDRGVGKSSLASRWVRTFQDDNSDICVIAHFVSASSGSADITVFIKQCIRQLRQRYLLTDGIGSDGIISEIENCIESGNEEFQYLCEAFLASVTLGPCVILLDGLNELGASHGMSAQQVKTLSWLPDTVPSTCKMILTTLRSDITHWTLTQRNDVTTLACPRSLTDVNTTLAMLKEHQPEIVLLLGGEREVEKLSSLRLLHTALGSRVIGSELTCCRTYSNLTDFLNNSAEIWSLRDFWITCVQLWVMEHSWCLENHRSEVNFKENGFDYSGWVMDALCLVCVSRNGLSQGQLLAILRQMGYEGDLEVSAFDWLQFRLSAGVTLREKADGRLMFGYKYLQEVAEYWFFKNMSKSSYDAISILKSPPSPLRKGYHTQLVRFFSQESLTSQVMEELPWQLMMSHNVTSLLNYLTDCGALLKMLTGDSELWHQDLTLYWSVCELSGQSVANVYLQLCHALGVTDVNDVQVLDDTVSHMESASSISATPRVVVSTPQPCWDDDGTQVEREEMECLESPLSYSEEMEKVTGIKTPDHLGEKDFSDGVFVTQVGQPISSSAQRLSGLDKDNFHGVVSLVWNIGRYLRDIGQAQSAKVVFISLVKYIKQNYPLTLEQHLLLCQCHYYIGQLSEQSNDLMNAQREYRLALQTVFDADEMDEDLTIQDNIQYLKGLLLSSHGRLQTRMGQWEQLYEAEELLKEALECVEETPNCLVLKSGIHYNLGLLRASQGDYIRAESCLQESGKLRCQWFGRSHPLVADVFIALGKLLADPANLKGCEELQAELFLRQALTIREKFYGPMHTSVAYVLSDLGKLLAENKSHPAKVEAQKWLSQALDIRTTQLGGSHPLTMSTQHSLTRLDIDLKLGHYEFGSAKHTDRRAGNMPFSALTFRESDLSRLHSRLSSGGKARLDHPMAVHGVTREEVMHHNRPDNMGCMTSASERLLSAHTSERPRLLHRDRASSHSTLHPQGAPHGGLDDSDIITIGGVDSSGSRVGHCEEYCHADSYSYQGILKPESDFAHQDAHNPHEGYSNGFDPGTPKEEEECHVVTVDLQGKGTTEGGEDAGEFPETPRVDSYANMGKEVLKDGREKKSVTLRPASVPKKMFQRYGSFNCEAIGRQAPTMAVKSSSSLSCSRRLWSGHSNITGLSSATSGHHSRCRIPGRHDINLSTTRSISGPHSCLSSLLGDHPCLRPSSSKVHHKSAWYHVPGRYHTPQERYPKKRMQKTENAKDIDAFMTLKSDWIKKQQRDAFKAQMNETENQHEGHLVLRAQTNSGSHSSEVAPVPSHGARYSSSNRSLRNLNKQQSATQQFNISGLDMVSELPYSKKVSTVQNHVVKFKEPVTVG